MHFIQAPIIVFIIFSTFYGIIHLLVRRRERIMMVEKGLTPEDTKFNFDVFSTLKLGIFMIGLGIGFLIGNILSHATSLESEVSYFSMIFIFGGISLILGHLIDNKKIAGDTKK